MSMSENDVSQVIEDDVGLGEVSQVSDELTLNDAASSNIQLVSNQDFLL